MKHIFITKKKADESQTDPIFSIIKRDTTSLIQHENYNPPVYSFRFTTISNIQGLGYLKASRSI